jgi:HlyD family secretion protein
MGALSRRVWVFLGTATLLVVVLLYLNSRRPVARVAVAEVTRGSLNSSITSNGKVEPVTPYVLRAKFDGFVVAVPAVEGQTVRPRQLLLSLDDSDVQAQLDQTRAQLASEEDDLHAAEAGGRADQAARVAGDLHTAEAQRDQLQKQQDVLSKLVQQKAATPEELEKNQATLERANADVDHLSKVKQEFAHQVQLDRERLALLVARSSAEVKSLEEKVESARVVAPVSGTLFSLPVHVRDFVHTGDLLAEVADLRQVRVRAFIDEPELGRLRPNQTVEVTWDAIPERTWVGRTETVPQQVVARGARNVGEILCAISNEGMSLIPNTSVDISIQLVERTNVLVVPRGAVLTEGPRHYVFLVDGERLHRKEIKIGASNETQFEVMSGLQEGDAVALPGDLPLRDNQVVRVVTPE